MSARLSPRINLSDPVKTPAPVWSGVKFTCERCTGEYQLEAADKCEHRRGVGWILTPGCPNCGLVNWVKLPGKKRD